MNLLQGSRLGGGKGGGKKEVQKVGGLRPCQKMIKLLSVPLAQLSDDVVA